MKHGRPSGKPGQIVVLRSGGTSGERVRLGVHDLLNGTFATPRTFFYRQTLDADALADSLRRTLAHHPLLTGRLERDPDGGLSVVCDDAGAMFAVTHSDQVMPDYGPDRSAKQDLRRYIHSVNAFRVVGHDTPLLTVKVTHMRGGGSVLGVAVNHSVVDGSGYLDFLRHWSRTHAGQDGSAAPYDRALLDDLAGEAPPAPDDPQYQVVTGRQKFGFIWRVNSRAWKVRTVTVRLTAAEVLALRAAARAGQDRDLPPASSAVALGAHLWRVLGALRDREPGAEERLGIVVGLRAVLKDRLPHGYGGNAVSNTTAVLSARELREEPLAHTVAAVRAAVQRVTPVRVRQEAAFLEAQRQAGRSARVLSRMSLDAFDGTVALNDSGRLPVYTLEFGAGRPFWFEFPASPIPWTALVTPTPDDDHSRDVHLSVPREAADALRSPRWAERLRGAADGPGGL
ncbi:shikimate O-hydroxycinnamoyltransferase [Streptomyces sp. B4I13]|uniref:acyltransferase n=1 Tax=Streptomyces sp. B4I13 TaxID=3042271 RepID=UPI00277D1C3F|nr:acyltransferase [Streptomyces sp. B4I13]MDQ0957011.1 shikimate O-hydroxycinnamoyltransferase [Streptomyces sp. B4I13]